MNDETEVKAIKKYAKENNLITVSPGTYHKWCDKNISCDLLGWVKIIKNAECVVTDTFHGTITASITNVPMAVLIRNSLNSNKMTDLLGKLGIENRRVDEVSEKELNKVFKTKLDVNILNRKY
jgi:exopolysaccharide biosynthesis predicted pyruvyltransferase EpsI